MYLFLPRFVEGGLQAVKKWRRAPTSATKQMKMNKLRHIVRQSGVTMAKLLLVERTNYGMNKLRHIVRRSGLTMAKLLLADMDWRC
jgi:hypothetical protein